MNTIQQNTWRVRASHHIAYASQMGLKAIDSSYGNDECPSIKFHLADSVVQVFLPYGEYKDYFVVIKDNDENYMDEFLEDSYLSVLHYIEHGTRYSVESKA